MELIEWQLVTDGVRWDLVPVKTDPESREQEVSKQELRVKDEYMYSEDDLDLLGRQFLDKIRLTGLKPVRSPRGPSESGRLHKRTRPQPLSTRRCHRCRCTCLKIHAKDLPLRRLR
jgi:hypothetical protein